MQRLNYFILLFCSWSFSAFSQAPFYYDSLAYRDKFDSTSFSIYFNKNSHELAPDQLDFLNSYLSIRKFAWDFEIFLSGHTDGDASDRYNLDLSERRVATIAQAFDDAGFRKARFSKSFLGETKPIASNATEEGRQLNRRVDVKMYYVFSDEYTIPCGGVRSVCKEDTLVPLPSGTLIKVNKCEYLKNPSCFNVSEFVSGDQVRAANLHTMDEDGNPLVSGGMLSFDICDSIEVTALVPKNRAENCLTGDMNLYAIDEKGNWKLIDGASVPIQMYQGQEYFQISLRGIGSINLDKTMTLPKRKQYTVFKAKRGIKLHRVSLQCDCPLSVLSNADVKRNGRKIKLPKVCCPNEPMVRIEYLDSSGMVQSTDYRGISKLDIAHKLGGCKQEEKWRWFIFRKRNKSMYKKYLVKKRDLN